ncbi:uncharacterized protein LOC129612239 [Condylostylus longicornis]|uniref:uncharacterized protein LOC129612239 n=1 Tax=Condylostylus longicornis TaxID=2530218 RepID=UPI00244E21D6|nr:uncharacterized protein LOC129612239 [Condylostylus longicornis]
MEVTTNHRDPKDEETPDVAKNSSIAKTEPHKWEFVWYRAIGLPLLHLLAFYSLYILIIHRYWGLFFYGIFVGLLSGLGITAGAHRLWTHRSYKAKWPLRLILAIFQAMAYQRSILTWSRDHRTHHKFCDTDADPHNSKRGFFFSHIGWLMIKKHPEVTIKGKLVDMSDLQADPIVMFQDKYYYIIMPLFGFILPPIPAWYFFGYDFYHSILIVSVLRWMYTLNVAFLVNSAAHLSGPKPYEKSVTSSENSLVIALAIGEGYHNFHHVFPWDYKAAELGGYYTNISKYFIEFCAKYGWAYDLKTVSEDTLRKRILRTGDGSHFALENMNVKELMENLDLDQANDKELIWGWNDNDMEDEYKKSAKIIYRRGTWSILFLKMLRSALVMHEILNNMEYSQTDCKSYNDPKKLIVKPKGYRWEWVWYRAIGLPVMHLIGFYGIYIMVVNLYWDLLIYSVFLGILSGLGTTMGAHRLWTHRAYKANAPMRFVLAIFQAMAYQRSILTWSRDHRSHHKFCDTDADPHNSTRGFWYSHIGWIMMKKHPDVVEKGKLIDMSDLEADPIVMWQDKYYYVIMPLIGFVFPAVSAYYIWGYPFEHCFLICSLLKWLYVLNVSFFVNSAAHLWGTKPYEKTVSSRESPLVIALAIGEGYHNFHHIFPWDYKASEFGTFFTNMSKYFIEICAQLGWAWDLKTVSEETLRKRIVRTGDGSHCTLKKIEEMNVNELIRELDATIEHDKSLIWGWNDKDLQEDFKNTARIMYRGVL